MYVVQVILYEIRSLPIELFVLPFPRFLRDALQAQELIADPAYKRGLERLV